MGWGQKIAGNAGSILKWTDVGQEVDGVLSAIRTTLARGQYKEGKLADIRKMDGTMVTVGVGTVLARQLAEVKIGQRIRILYLGKERGSAGQEYHNFELTPWVDDDAAPASAAQPPGGVTQFTPAPSSKPTFEALKAALVKAKGADTGNAIADAITSMGGDPVERMMKTLIAQGVAF